MTDSKTRYKLAEQKAMQRINELQQESSRLSDDDVALTRFLIEQATNNGNTSLANKLLDTLSKLTNAADTSAEKHGELIGRSRLIEIVQDLTSLVVEAFEDSCPDWEQRIDNLSQKMINTLGDQPCNE